MPVTKNRARNQSRREFLKKGSMASAGVLMAASLFSKPFSRLNGPGSRFFGVQIGVITYSFRGLPGSAEQTLKYITDSGISSIELMGDPP